MNDHKVIDTSKMRNRRLTFKNLTTKQKNILIGGGLSFAGVMAAVGINRLFAPDELNDVVTDNIHEAIADQSIVNTPAQPEVTNREEPIDVDTPEESAVDEVYSVSIETDARFATSVDDGILSLQKNGTMLILLSSKSFLPVLMNNCTSKLRL